MELWYELEADEMSVKPPCCNCRRPASHERVEYHLIFACCEPDEKFDNIRRVRAVNLTRIQVHGTDAVLKV
jgi:hypothetical protein